MTCKSTGPQPATILIVGEAPGVDEIRMGEPFVGLSGKELTRMLHDAGIMRQACRITNVTMERPEGNDISTFFATRTQATPAHQYIAGGWCSSAITSGLAALRQEVARTNPRVILALGDTALWALTGASGITKWRGSHMDLDPVYGGPVPTDAVVIPTYHPAAILRQWSWRYIAVQDMRRAAEIANGQPAHRPIEDYAVPTSLQSALAAIDELRAFNGPSSLVGCE